MINNSKLNNDIEIEYGDSYQAIVAKNSVDIGTKFTNKLMNGCQLNSISCRQAIYNEMLAKYDHGDTNYLLQLILHIIVKQVLWWLSGKILQQTLDDKPQN